MYVMLCCFSWTAERLAFNLLHVYDTVELMFCYLHSHLVSGEGVVSLGIMRCVCVSAEPRMQAALVSTEKVMRCIQCCLVKTAVVYGNLPCGAGWTIGMELKTFCKSPVWPNLE